MNENTYKQNSIPVFGQRTEGCPYVVRPSAYALLQDAVGRIALVLTPTGYYLPGGGVDPEESAEVAAVREMEEECGLIVQPVAVLGNALEIVYAERDNICYEKDSTFVITELVGYGVPIESDHILAWTDPETAITIIAHGSHRWALQQLVNTTP